MRGKATVIQSDHNSLIAQFNQLWSDKYTQENERYEIFNFKDPEGILRFHDLTSSSTLSNCIQDNNVKTSSKKWIKNFKNILHRSFKKVRIRNKKIHNEEVHNLMRAKTLINIKIAELSEEIQLNPSDIQPKSQILVSLQENIDQLDIKIADICALKNMKIIKDHYESVTLGDGSFNIPKMWGLKKKLSLKSSEGPSAKKDKSGNLITSKNGLLALYKNTYIDRLSHKNIRPEYEHLKSMKETLFELRYELASGDKSEN